MSNFIGKAKNPKTHIETQALFVDDGRCYKVVFNEDGSDYDFMQSKKKKTFLVEEKELKS